MSTRLSMKVIRGVIALGKPGVSDAINFPVNRQEMRKRGVWHKDVDDGIRALEWAAAVKLREESKGNL
jgi:hypothetical protein